MTNDLVRLVEKVEVTKIMKIPKWVLEYVTNKYIGANKPDIKLIIDYQA